MAEKDKKFIPFITSILKNQNTDTQEDFSNLRELIGAMASWAGKGKDELVQILCREIGVATAAMFREPLSQILENRKLQITFEFVPKDGKPANKSKAKTKSKSKKVKKTKTKTRRA